MTQKILKYLTVGWHRAHDLHTAHWIMLGLISLLPASLATALTGFVGEHSAFLLFAIFLLCFGTVSLMILALLGHPQKVAGQLSHEIGNKNAIPARATDDALAKFPLTDRIYHFRSDVNFDRIGEYLIKFELAFFNGTGERIVIEKVSGLVTCDPPFNEFHLEPSYMAANQTTTEARPLDRFGVTVEQRVPRELAPLIIQKLDTGMPFSFTLTGLMISLRPASGTASFTAKLWHGISCEKNRNYIVCAECVPMSGRATAND